MEDFESLPEFQALAVAAAGKPERSMGESIIPREPPQWNEVRKLAKELAKTASDQLALHVYLIQAEANVNGFVGFREAFQNTLDLLENNWDSLFPGPDLDDPDDMYYARVNLMTELSEQPAFLDDLHRLPLVNVRGIGEFSARDLDISAGTVQGTDEDRDRCQTGLITGAFAESDPEKLQQLAEALDALPGMLTKAESVIGDKSGQPGVLSLDRLKQRVEGARSRFHEYADAHLAAPVAEEESLDEAASDAAPPGTTPASPANSLSTLNSRDMVLASFDAILLYYQSHEPSSPVRVLTMRAREFVDKPFFEVIQALAANGQDDLPVLLASLQKQPIAALLLDSYSRFLAGEALPMISGNSLPDNSNQSDSSDNESEMDQGTTAQTEQVSGNSDNVVVISSREQVLVVLHDIETFFTHAEPASPIPLIIADIKSLVPKRFSELVAEFSRVVPHSSEASSE